MRNEYEQQWDVIPSEFLKSFKNGFHIMYRKLLICYVEILNAFFSFSALTPLTLKRKKDQNHRTNE